MRGNEEIVNRIRQMQDDRSDVFGFIRSDLVHYLPFSSAKEFLAERSEDESWGEIPRDYDSITNGMLDYMPFAWEKANNCRGLSSARSLNHMQAWLWMLGQDEAAAGLNEYTHYGKPQLRAICEYFVWDWTKWDNGMWRNNELDPASEPLPAVDLKWVPHSSRQSK